MIIYIYLLVINIILFVLMGIDKFKAQASLWRIPEKALLIFGALGGGFGGFIGGRIFHHKTRKWYFQVVWVIGIVVAIGLIGLRMMNFLPLD